MNYHTSEGATRTLIKMAAEGKNRPLNLSDADKFMLGDHGMKGAQDEANGRPGENRAGVIARTATGGALMGTGIGGLIGGRNRDVNIEVPLGNGRRVNAQIQVPGSLKSVGKGMLIGGAIGGTAIGALGSKAYSIGADFQKDRQKKKLAKQASESGGRQKPEEKKSLMELSKAHIASHIPYGAAAYGVLDGAEDGRKLKGFLLGQHGVQGARDKEQGVSGQNLKGVVGSGLATGGVLGAGISAYKGGVRKPGSVKRIAGDVVTGALGTAGGGALAYGLGSLTASAPKDKR